MRQEDVEKLYTDAITLWGENDQINQCQEELAELIVALNHVRRKMKGFDPRELAEELVDAMICIDQMIFMFRDRMPITLMEQVRGQKLERLKGIVLSEYINITRRQLEDGDKMPSTTMHG